ncbi:MAG: efflux RND transporter permease subunit [Cyanobacteria bacterium P01_H01_bin.15]
MIFSIADIFIKRPVLTTVCTIIILLVGGISIPLLPIAKLPQIAPTQVSVSSTYTGADPQTTEKTVTTIIEREINGVEELRYMDSTTDINGRSTINVSFPTTVDRNTAQVNVQNRVAQAESQLPEAVRQTGVTTEKASPNILLALAFYSELDDNGEPIYSTEFISNYADLFIFDELKRSPGVGSLTVFGERKYAMRIWLDPESLAARDLTASDVVNAISEQNIQVGAGKIGGAPVPAGQEYEVALQAVGRFQNAEEAEDIVVQVQSDGTLIKIKDVGRAELGAEDYSLNTVYNGNASVGYAVYQLPGSNALDTADNIKATMERLSGDFPPGMTYAIAFDTTLFVSSSIKEVVISLVQAIALVVLIIFVFLQDWRTTLIPAIAIPVSMIGAMAGLMALGFELNNMTLFGCVLATGLVVDDGIVVVEAVSKKINEQRMSPMEAALDSMNELTGAVISTSLVLMAVFIPVSFFPGSTGIVYKQFALTIAFAIAFSTFNALTFSPSMSAVILRRQEPMGGPLGWFFNKFNQAFAWTTQRYRSLVSMLIGVRYLVLPIFVAGLVGTVFMYGIVPGGFIPEEDQGYIFIVGEAPAGVSLEYSSRILPKVDRIARETEGVESAFGFSGSSFEEQAANKILFFIRLTDWSERASAKDSAFGIIGQIQARLFQEIPEARLQVVNAPPVDGLSSTGGFEMWVQNRAGLPIDELISNVENLIAKAQQREELGQVYTLFTSFTPQTKVEVFRNSAKALNVDINEIFSTLQTYLGSNYVNDFVLGQRQYRVYAQAEGRFRSKKEDIGRLYVRSRDGELIQLSNLVKTEDILAPPVINHYNVYQSIKVQGAPAQGFSSGQAIAAMEEVANEVLQPGFSFEWTGTALEEKTSGGAAPIIFGLGFVMVFLVLAAQYESYVDPTIIMLTVPLAVLGALLGIWFRSTFIQTSGIWPLVSNSVYCQVGLVMLIGMASKNTILIVEFANQSRQQGMDIVRAAVFAAEQRFRPILMTAISSLVGFWPLVVATGAGAISRWELGTAVFGGMLISTVLSLLLAPVLYVVIKQFEARFLMSGGGGDDTGADGHDDYDYDYDDDVDDVDVAPDYEEEEQTTPAFKTFPQPES